MRIQKTNNQQAFTATAKDFQALPKALLTKAERKARLTCKVDLYIGNSNESVTGSMLQRLKKDVQSGKVRRLVPNPREVQGYKQVQTYKIDGKVVVLATVPTRKNGIPAKIFKFSPRNESGVEIHRAHSEDFEFDEAASALNALA